MPNLGDLTTLIEDEGYRGEFFEPESVTSLANAIEAIVTNNEYRTELEIANYKAATAYPMERITNMYLAEFEAIINKNKQVKNNKFAKTPVVLK